MFRKTGGLKTIKMIINEIEVNDYCTIKRKAIFVQYSTDYNLARSHFLHIPRSRMVSYQGHPLEYSCEEDRELHHLHILDSDPDPD